MRREKGIVIVLSVVRYIVIISGKAMKRIHEEKTEARGTEKSRGREEEELG